MMTVAELIERLRQPDVDPKWPVFLNPYGENLHLEEVQPEPHGEYLVLVSE